MFLPNTLWVGAWTHKHLLSFGLFQIPILTRYLEDFGCLGNIPRILQIRHERVFFFFERHRIHGNRNELRRENPSPQATAVFGPQKKTLQRLQQIHWRGGKRTDNTGGWRRKQQARGDMYIIIMYKIQCIYKYVFFIYIWVYYCIWDYSGITSLPKKNGPFELDLYWIHHVTCIYSIPTVHLPQNLTRCKWVYPTLIDGHICTVYTNMYTVYIIYRHIMFLNVCWTRQRDPLLGCPRKLVKGLIS